MQGFTIKKEKKTIRFDYKIHKKCLKKVDHTKYLGFLFDKKNQQTPMEMACLQYNFRS